MNQTKLTWSEVYDMPNIHRPASTRLPPPVDIVNTLVLSTFVTIHCHCTLPLSTTVVHLCRHRRIFIVSPNEHPAAPTPMSNSLLLFTVIILLAWDFQLSLFYMNLIYEVDINTKCMKVSHVVNPKVKIRQLKFSTIMIKELEDVFDSSNSLKLFKNQRHVETHMKKKAHVEIYMSKPGEITFVDNYWYT